jgi:hypothetical protein
MCKIAKSREWALRIGHELAYHEESVFATLTYRDEFLPPLCSLEKRALRNYIKRLRKRYEPKRIRYFASGEYGEENGRPHYHLILFGVRLDEHELELVDRSDQLKGYKCHKGPVKDCWYDVDTGYSLGHVVLGTVTYNSARYTADYMQKAFDKEYNKKVYGDLEPPFSLKSQGLGKDYMFDNAEMLCYNASTTVRGVEIALPKYYQNKLFDTPEKKEILRLKAEEAEEEARDYWRKRGFDAIGQEKKLKESRLQHAKTQFARVDLKKKRGV